MTLIRTKPKFSKDDKVATADGRVHGRVKAVREVRTQLENGDKRTDWYLDVEWVDGITSTIHEDGVLRRYTEQSPKYGRRF